MRLGWIRFRVEVRLSLRLGLGLGLGLGLEFDFGLVWVRKLWNPRLGPDQILIF